jgi:rare lipoprotein A
LLTKKTMFKNPTKISLSLGLAILMLSSTASAAFTDVPSTYIYSNSINALQTQGCIKGYEDNTFKPDNNITRAETLKLLLTCINVPKIYSEDIFQVPAGSSYLVNGAETKISLDSELKIKIPFNPTTYPDLEFSDVVKGAWYEGVLKESLVRKIITGYADNTIQPTKNVNKAEFYTMLFRLVPTELRKGDVTKDVAKDALKEQWFAESLSFAVMNNLLSVNAEGNISPYKELTRGHVAHFIYQYNQWLALKVGTSTTPAPAATPVTPTPTTPTTPATPSTTPPATTTPPAATVPTTTVKVGDKETGKASFYGTKIAGAKTASGALYDPESLIVAHKTLPFGTIVKITNKANGKWVKASVIDRGPYVEGRILDLSNAAFSSIGELSSGVLDVEMEIDTLPNS